MTDVIDDLRDILKQAKDHNPLAYPLIAPVYERAIAEIEMLRAALQAVSDCDDKHDLTPYDYLHGGDEVRNVMCKVKDALKINVGEHDR